ncbi:hypothetical protein RHECNPAF_564004 [Rhizobium etli CNPAF512]|nr:hypothetical protein RHECNPAF_564004 [Rhizobium etli CNPAF512]
MFPRLIRLTAIEVKMSCRRWDGCDDFRYSAHYESDYATYVLNPHSLIEAPLRGTAFPFPKK